MDRVCIFIDGSNFYHALKGAGLPVTVDFGKLSEKLITAASAYKPIPAKLIKACLR